MKPKALVVKGCVFLLLSSFLISVHAQKKAPVKKTASLAALPDKTSVTTPEIKDFAFVVEIDKNAQVVVRVQKTENSEFLASDSSNKNLTDFFTAFSALQEGKTAKTKTALEPIIIVRADQSLNLSKITEVIQSVRVSSKQKIKLQISENDYVGIPPLVNENEFPKPNPSFLLVKLQADSKILLNTENYGDFKNTAPLQEKLREIFKQRESFGIFRPGTNEVEKTVFIAAPPTVKFADVIKLIQVIKDAGAEPVGLQLEDLFTEMRVIT
ncbi:MAG TPA: hypothetical protein VNB22_22530 [Pyrinomonadaceae bacterium]|jgi:biopolymer transport protein ExbD|nr:hypothetical protein [Pyrinomonadaceae bacterium]